MGTPKLLKKRNHDPGDLSIFYLYKKELDPNTHEKLGKKYPSIILYWLGGTKTLWDSLQIRSFRIASIDFSRVDTPLYYSPAFDSSGKRRKIQDTYEYYRESMFSTTKEDRTLNYLGTVPGVKYEDLNSPNEAFELIRPYGDIL